MQNNYSKTKLLLAVLFIVQGMNVFSQTFQDNWWRPNGPVHSLLKDGNTVYIGGDFTYVGPDAPYGSPVDLATGDPDLAFPRPDGSVYAAVSDGSGGWYIGGNFNKVGDSIRHNLARVNANGTVNAWNPDINGNIKVMELSGSTLYVGGDFWEVGDSLRGDIAAISTTTGRATAWKPSLSSSSGASRINSLILSGSTLYAGGSFTSIGGKARNNVAALSTTTDTALNWNPNANAEVYTLVINGGGMFMGGNFTQLGGQSRAYLGEALLTTGAATSWNPTANGTIYSLAIAGSRVYAGGNFTIVNTRARNFIACLDLNTGSATDWNPNANSIVRKVLHINGKLFAVGHFTAIASETRGRVAELDTATGLNTAWNTAANGTIYTIATNGSDIYLGGFFKSVGGENRGNFAAMNATTGEPINVNIKFNEPVYCLALSGSRLYAGGDFTLANGFSRRRIAAINTTTGTLTGFNPLFNKMVKAIAAKDNSVYVGGEFDTVGATRCVRLVALDTTGSIKPFLLSTNASTYSMVNALVLHGNIIYAGGDFTSIGGQSRNRIAALDAATGAVLSWNPNANNDVNALAVSAGKVYAGGNFSFIGGQTRSAMAALDSATGAATAWNPQIDGIIRAIAVGNSFVFAGGSFGYVKSYLRSNLAALDTITGQPLAWRPNPSSTVNALVANGTQVFAGGYFNSAGGFYNTGAKPRPNLLVVTLNNNIMIEEIKRELAFCPGDTLTINYTLTGTFNPGNVFTLQMSNGVGSFSSPVTIGTATSTTYGSILATIPANTPDGNNYQIRIVSSNPSLTSEIYPFAFEIKSTYIPWVDAGSPASVCFTTPYEINVYAVSQYIGANPVYTWRLNGNVVQVDTGTTTSYSFLPVHMDKISLSLKSSLSCAAPDTAINKDTIRVYLNTLSINAGADKRVASGSNVALSATASGGTAPLSYGWYYYDGTAELTNYAIRNPTVLGITDPTWYYVSVYDANGCSASDAIFIDILPPPIIVTGITSATCTPGATGSIALEVSGGVPPYTYAWSNSATTDDISGLAAGTYTVTVQDDNYTTVAKSYTVGSTTSAPAAPSSITGTTVGLCESGISSAVYKATVSGATGYNWTAPSGSSIIAGQGTNTITLGFDVGFTTGSLSVVAVNNCGTSLPKSVTLKSLPGKPGTITGNSSNCPNTSASYSVAAVSGAVYYNWIAPANATISSGQGTRTVTVSFLPSFTTGDTLKVSVSNACGESDVQWKLIGVSSTLPTPGAISGSASACANTSGSYSISAVSGANSYTWTAPTGASITSGHGTTTVTVSFSPSFSAGNLSVVANSACGSSNARTKAISPGSLPTPGGISGSTNVCSGGSANYSIATVSGATDYLWTAPANASITGGQGTTNVTVTFSGAFSSGSLTVQATSTCGASLPRSLAISSGALTSPVISGPIYGLCPSGMGSATYTCTSVTGASSYVWAVPTGVNILSGQGTPSVLLEFTAAFTRGGLSVAATSSCGSTGSPSLTLYSTPPKASKMYGSFAICPGVATTYSTAAMPGTTQYTWTVPAGWTINSGQGTTSINVTTGSAGGYIVLTTDNACGASFPLSKAVSVLTGCSSKTGDEANESHTADDEEMENTDRLSVYPNPFSANFTVAFTAQQDMPVKGQIVDAMGRLVYSFADMATAGENQFSIDLNNQPGGVYLLSLQQGHLVKHIRMIKQ